MTMKVTSSAFQAGQAIPAKYTCEGADISPPLEWSGVPAAAKSLALICDDPDAPGGTWVHWVL
jgi:Raf kinase inhibitor-like YbhB/YbcL family protein